MSRLLWLLIPAAFLLAVLLELGDDPVRVETVATTSTTSTVPSTTTSVATTTTHYHPPTTARPVTTTVARSAPNPGARCGGDLPPCWVMMRESGGDPNAYNPTGCGGRGCRGKWQCDPRTCSGTGTEEEQDAEARALWNNGKGCSHWAAC